MDKFRLDHKVALVSGGSKGIGFGIATALAEAGSDLVLVARDKKTLDAARDKLSDTGRKVRIYSFDMSNTDKISELYAEIANDTGGIDILVNNAGGTRRGPADMLTSLRATYYTSTADFSAPSAPVPGSFEFLKA